MKTQLETGMPYIFFKDRANEVNHNSHMGMIGNGNLCMESFSNFKPTINFVEEEDGNTSIRKSEMGEIHTCNLISLNLAELTSDELEKHVALAVRALDNTIDLTVTPLKESNKHNLLYRTIGVGAMGLADYLAREYMIYEESINEINEIFERIALYSIKASALLAKDRGAYKAFKGSKWDQGIFYGKKREWYDTNSKFKDEWNEAFYLVEANGLRNGELTAIAPNTSTSLLMGSTASVTPTFSRFFIEKNQRGAIPRTVKHLKDRANFIPEDILPPQKKFKVQVEVSFQKQEGGIFRPITQNGQVAKELEERTFTTGTAPNYIPLQNIEYAYPVVSQKFFLKDEFEQGYVKLKQGQDYLFEGNQWENGVKMGFVNQ